MSFEDSYFNVVKIDSFVKSIKIPTSKSFSNRAIILAALIDEPVTINNISSSSDVENMINALKEVGLSITRKDKKK